MARPKHKKKKKGSASGFFGGLVVLCLLAVGVIAVAKHFSPQNDPVPNPELSASAASSEVTSSTDKTTDSASEQTESNTTDTNATNPTSERTSASQSTSTKTDKTPYESTNDTSSFDKSEWYMILANPTNYLPEGFSFPQAKIYSAGQNWIVDARCAEDMKAMLAAAKEDGVDLMICSAYRSVEYQTQLYNNRVQKYINEGYNREEAQKIAATINAVPGTSEHHTGLAADIVTPSYQSLNSGFAQTEAFRWLYAHCAEYGFIMRYAEDKQDITGIIYEPWHYRYVGKQAAEIIMREGICFEEFLEQYGT